MQVGDLVKYVLRSGEEVTALILRFEDIHAEIYFSKSGEQGWTPIENLQVIE